MGQRTTLTTHEYLVNAVLPEPTETYTVISHQSIIEKTKEALAAHGFEIIRELYRCNQGAKIAQGVYHLKYGEDPDMGMMFAWSNSYDKSMRFKCSIGGYVHTSLSSVISHETASTWDRKHTGNADQEAFDTIENQLTNAENYFLQLVSDKELMKKIVITEKTRAELMGRIYLIHDLLTTEQLSTVKAQFNKPSFTCSGEKDSVWEMYNAIIIALQQAHPKNWMDQQKLIHWFLCDHFDTKAGALSFLNPESTEEIKDPNQLNIIDEIAKVETPAVEMLREEADMDLSGAQPDPVVSTSLAFQKGGPIPVSEPEEGPFEPVNETIMEECTEGELNHELHGVDNDNIEVTLPEASDDSWICLSCKNVQGPEDAFHDGQLCTNCHTILVENGELNQ